MQKRLDHSHYVIFGLVILVLVMGLIGNVYSIDRVVFEPKEGQAVPKVQEEQYGFPYYGGVQGGEQQNVGAKVSPSVVGHSLDQIAGLDIVKRNNAVDKADSLQVFNGDTATSILEAKMINDQVKLVSKNGRPVVVDSATRADSANVANGVVGANNVNGVVGGNSWPDGDYCIFRIRGGHEIDCQHLVCPAGFNLKYNLQVNENYFFTLRVVEVEDGREIMHNAQEPNQPRICICCRN